MDRDTNEVRAAGTGNTRHGGRNPQLEFFLAGYVNPAALPGDRADPLTQSQSILAMHRYARRCAFDPTDAAEGLSRVFQQVGESDLTERYRQRPGGVRPLAQRMIQRAVWKARAERCRGAGPIPLEPMAHDPGPAALAEASDLGQACQQALTGVRPDSSQRPTKPGSSTPHVRRHRERERKWKRVAHLFPGLTDWQVKRRR